MVDRSRTGKATLKLSTTVPQRAPLAAVAKMLNMLILAVDLQFSSARFVTKVVAAVMAEPSFPHKSPAGLVTGQYKSCNSFAKIVHSPHGSFADSTVLHNGVVLPAVAPKRTSSYNLLHSLGAIVQDGDGEVNVPGFWRYGFPHADALSVTQEESVG